MRGQAVREQAHVLVSRLDGDGDVLLTGPAVRAVAAGARRVTFVSSPAAAPAARMLPGVDEVVEFEAAWVPADPPALERRAVLALVDRLAGLAVEQALVMTSFHQSPLPMALLLRMAGVAEVAAICVDYPGSLLDVRHQVPDDLHEVERNLSLAARLGHTLPTGDDGRLRVRRDRGAGPGRWSGATGRYVVVHPGASVPARAWAPERNVELARRLAEAGWQVVVTGSASERALCEQVAGATAGVVSLAGRTDYPALADVLAGAEAVVVGNTGPAHLAAAVGTPVVSIFAPTVPAARWRPWRVPHVLLGVQDITCAGCRARTCPIQGQPCIGDLQVADVIAALERLLERGREAA